MIDSFSLFKIDGAKSFTDFLGGGKKSPRSKKRRSLRRTVRERTGRKYKRRTARRTSRRTARRTSRRTARRTARSTTRRTARRTTRRTAQRTSRRTARRTSRRTSRRSLEKGGLKRNIRVRNLSKRKFVGSPGKYQCVNGCDKNTKGGYFTGKEPSPKGMGYCARCTPLNIMMKGADGNLWEIKKYSKGKRWVRV